MGLNTYYLRKPFLTSSKVPGSGVRQEVCLFQRADSNGVRLLRELQVMRNTKCALDVKRVDKSSTRKSGVQVNLCLSFVTSTTISVQATE